MAPRAANPIDTVTRTEEAREKAVESRGTSGQIVHTSGPTAEMKKTIKRHRGRLTLKERMWKNSRAWPDEEGEWCWPEKSRITIPLSRRR